MFLTSSLPEIAAHFGASIEATVEATPRLNIAPGKNIVVCSPERDLVAMRWGIIPVGRVNARGRPVMETVINARSETVFTKSAFEGVGRCLVPVHGWYEWTGKTRRKTAWRLRLKSRVIMAIAAIYDVWTGPGGVIVPQVATITCEPNADVRPIHHRMGVFLDSQDFETWLCGTEAEATALMRPLADGLLEIEQADDVDFSGA